MKELTDAEFNQLRGYIKKNFGISLSDEKKSLVFSRLRSTLIEKGMNDFSEYYKFLVNDKSGEAVINFINKITTNHTFFMRETDHFDYLRDAVLPYIDATYSKTRDLRLWCAASSSGEEPYTLQMIIQDYFKDKGQWDTKILATDISTNVLEKAVKGIYPTEAVKTLPEKWQKTYFTDYDAEKKIVVNSIKNEILFRKFNLMNETFPFKKKFQIIFCRNVMIYFDNETKNKLIDKFFDIIEPGGYLFIGHSESLGHSSQGFKYIKPAIYRKE